jgi:transmembrane sensor
MAEQPRQNLPNILETAALWHSRLNDEHDPLLAAEFERWLAADRHHLAAWAEIDRASAMAASVLTTNEMQALRTEALTWAADRRRRIRFIGGGALALATCLAMFLLAQLVTSVLGNSGEPARYATGPGERLIVTLDDGSTATLDASSKLSVAFDGSERQLDLQTGQALFEVAKGDHRPFVVEAGKRSIVAHGTLFNVWRRPDHLRVVLVEGSIGVGKPHDIAGPTIVMRANQVLDVQGSTALLRSDPNAAGAIGWRDGILQFDDVPLSDALDQVNRYAKRPIRLSDPILGRTRISGIFHVGDVVAFLSALDASLGIRIIEQSGAEVVIGRRSPMSAGSPST